MNDTNTGVEFNFSFAPGITEEQILGFELAGEMWSQYLGDTHLDVDEGKDFTVNIHVEVTNSLLPNNVLGGAFPAIETGKRYKDFHKATVNDVSTQNDQIVVDNLLDTDKVDILVGDRVVGNDHMHMTRANLKALNLIKADDDKLDGYIVINDLSNINAVEWNYNYLGGAKAGTIDFLSTATHEVGHILGFISGTDKTKLPTQLVQQYTNSGANNIIRQALSVQETGGYYVEFNSGTEVTGTPNIQANLVEFKGSYQQQDLQRVTDAIQTLQNLEDYNSRDQARHAINTIKDFLKRDKDLEEVIKNDDDIKDILDNLADVQDSQSYSKYMTSMDLFRYSAESNNLGINDLSVGNAAYFSLDGSQTDLGLSKGTSYDYQGSHWENREHGNGLGVMNPTIALNEQWTISQNDLLVMDAIGWDVVYPGEVDLETLYNNAVVEADTASIEDKNKDVEKLLESEAYNWSRRSSGASNSSFWQEGYFSTFNVETQVIATEDYTADNSSDCDSNCTEDNHDENNLFVSEKIVIETVFSTTKSDRAEPASQAGRPSTDNTNNEISQSDETENLSTLNQNNNSDYSEQKRQNRTQFLLDTSLVNPLVNDIIESLVTLNH